MGFAGMPDEEIVRRAKNDDEALEFLLQKYKNLVRSKARSYFLIGADKEDIVQEGMIGLYKAIRDYSPDKRASFRVFAELCITRQIITAIKTATRQKHKPLNSYVSLNKPVYDEESERMLMDVLVGVKVSNPEEIFIDKEDFHIIEGEISKMLSKLEKTVLIYYLNGKSYMEIAQAMERPEKSIDNALQRAKGKIDKYLAGKEGQKA
ncbi:RNA polymerase sporulation sigma factor SigH [Christensenellaceae bacterium OttesenSCG-928-K19]|nr:RNA polymerase sporulation sigma factor SigH [Christensenellaceae bacterium OttesenSCG-928-K19]